MKRIHMLAIAAVFVLAYGMAFFARSARQHRSTIVLVVGTSQTGHSIFPTDGYQRFQNAGSVPWDSVFKTATECSKDELLNIKESMFVFAQVDSEYGPGNTKNLQILTNWGFWRFKQMVSYGDGSNITYVDMLRDPSTNRLLLSAPVLRSPVRTTVSLYRHSRSEILTAGKSGLNDREIQAINSQCLRDSIRFTENLEQFISDRFREIPEDAVPWISDVIEVRERLKLELFRVSGEKWQDNEPRPKPKSKPDRSLTA